MVALWWPLLIIAVLLYLALTQFILPTVFFKPHYQIRRSLDRGVVNYTRQHGRSILYLPKKEYSKYINQYILSTKDNKTTIICKLPDTISFINYDIVLFTSYGRAFSTINVKENIKKVGYTRQLDLPLNTAYANIIVNSVDNETLPVKKSRKLNIRNCSFVAIILVLSVLLVFFIKECMGQIYSDVFIWDFMADVKSNVLLFFMGVGVTALDLGLLYLNILLQKRRQA